MQDIIEKFKLSFETAHAKDKEWFPILTKDAEVILRALAMFCWGVDKGETIVVSRKGRFGMAMVMRVDKSPIASIEGAYPRDPIAIAEAVEATLTDLAAGVGVLIEAMER